jgi:hypothetical protein
MNIYTNYNTNYNTNNNTNNKHYITTIMTTDTMLKAIGNACLATYNINKDNLTLQLFERYQSGESTIANPKYVELPYEYHTVYFNVEGHYAQAIYLKCSLDKNTWATIHSDSDH